jgi:hypothetical protein
MKLSVVCAKAGSDLGSPKLSSAVSLAGTSRVVKSKLEADVGGGSLCALVLLTTQHELSQLDVGELLSCDVEIHQPMTKAWDAQDVLVGRFEDEGV